MTAPMSLQPWWWQIFILIQLRSQFFQMFVYGDVVYAQTWYWPWNTVSSHLHMPGRPMFLQYGPHFFSTLSQKFGQLDRFYWANGLPPPPPPHPWQKISRTPMVTVPTWVAHSFQKHTQSFHTVEHSPLLTVESGRQLQCFSKARKVGFFNVELCFTFGWIDVIEIERVILLVIKVGIFLTDKRHKEGQTLHQKRRC